ncbi:NAD(P)-dependent oxidoreductase [Candidatus Peregrinibacteria bacterium]|jgi:nucleoside-diphosphate-sugar epimerase|nr:NAD(P)-dependent oxidoreductase [Candidatus Peregrinibacteria bacterium]MBT7928377.1 NAD(P)-dependent oxidoreductase [Candidatus Peregrinibacteria bacterium]
MNSKISLFGNGYIGKEFVRQFEDDVIIQDKFDYASRTPKVLYGISTVHNYHVKKKPYLDIDTNLTTLVTFLENMRRIHGEKSDITFLSSWFVYGRQDFVPVKETACCNPTGFYSVTKYAAEMLLASYCKTYNMKYRILRLCNVIGGVDEKADRKKNALQYMITELVKGRKVDYLYDTECYRDYMDVRDVVRAIKIAMTSESGEIINIGSGNGRIVKEIIEDVHCEVRGINLLELIPIPKFHKDVQTDNMVLDVSKLKSMGFVQQYSLQDTIEDIIKHAK